MASGSLPINLLQTHEHPQPTTHTRLANCSSACITQVALSSFVKGITGWQSAFE